MKDKRNCQNNYPIYQPQMMAPPMYPSYPYVNGYEMPNNQISSIEQRLNSLEQRVNKLEGNTNYSKYNDSNYYMV